MGPITLFDKSFLQSLSLDESVWFGHFYKPVVCPVFFVETLANLEKAVGEGRTPEQVVGMIADKFPEMSSEPCIYHQSLVLGELHGYPVPMDGRIPVPGGRPVKRDGKIGMLFDQSPEAEAFSRWQNGRFMDIERGMAKQWRAELGTLDIAPITENLRKLGIDQKLCKSLEDCKKLAEVIVNDNSKPFVCMALAIAFFRIPHQYHRDILERWSLFGYKRLGGYAPYTSYAMTVELFYFFAVAAHLISDQRASNRVDISYLHYLPFSHMFVSTDKLHRKCASLFLRDDQRFVWGQDLKIDLAEINGHFAGLPEVELERGITAFAKAPPETTSSLTRELRQVFLRPGVDDEKQGADPTSRDSEAEKKLVENLKQWEKAPSVDFSELPADDEDLQLMSFKRMVPKKKGSWWVLPKDLKADDKDD